MKSRNYKAKTNLSNSSMLTPAGFLVPDAIRAGAPNILAPYNQRQEIAVGDPATGGPASAQRYNQLLLTRTSTLDEGYLPALSYIEEANLIPYGIGGSDSGVPNLVTLRINQNFQAMRASLVAAQYTTLPIFKYHTVTENNPKVWSDMDPFMVFYLFHEHDIGYLISLIAHYYRWLGLTEVMMNYDQLHKSVFQKANARLKRRQIQQDILALTTLVKDEPIDHTLAEQLAQHLMISKSTNGFNSPFWYIQLVKWTLPSIVPPKLILSTNYEYMASAVPGKLFASGDDSPLAFGPLYDYTTLIDPTDFITKVLGGQVINNKPYFPPGNPTNGLVEHVNQEIDNFLNLIEKTATTYVDFLAQYGDYKTLMQLAITNGRLSDNVKTGFEVSPIIMSYIPIFQDVCSVMQVVIDKPDAMEVNENNVNIMVPYDDYGLLSNFRGNYVLNYINNDPEVAAYIQFQQAWPIVVDLYGRGIEPDANGVYGITSPTAATPLKWEYLPTGATTTIETTFKTQAGYVLTTSDHIWWNIPHTEPLPAGEVIVEQIGASFNRGAYTDITTARLVTFDRTLRSMYSASWLADKYYSQSIIAEIQMSFQRVLVTAMTIAANVSLMV